jgi:hypothetical protein
MRGKALGRNILLQTRQAGFGISAAKNPCAEASPISRLSRFGFHALNIFPLGQKSLANAAGTPDSRKHRFAAALEEHCLDNPHALHATGTTSNS